MAFIGSGFAFASWASRIPQVRDQLRLSPGRLGLLLLSIAAGSLLALPLAGPVVHRFGARRTVAVMAGLLGVGLAVTAVGYRIGVAPVAVGLFLLGFGNGGWDVAMNVHGALVERHLGRSIMSRFHAGYSLGTVAGALSGAAVVAGHLNVTGHLVAVAIVTVVAVVGATRAFLDDGAAAGVPREQPETVGRRGAFGAWREPRTLIVGVFVLAFAFAEGTGNDWISVATIDGYDTSAAVGTLAFATFLTAMTVGRWFGPAALDRHGRVPVVRALAGVAVGGSLLFVFAPSAPAAFAGAALWGLGTSLGFPVGMSAGADEPRYAAGRVSVIASIGYCAFLAGPPAVGFLGDRFSVLHALVTVTALVALAAAISPAVSPPTANAPQRNA
ncbi:MAG TPA: MFS transporter [Jatrophihabitantaceae bacterium]|nr:MFS transporter [Jatrophihabitantaceae bacterium]